MYAGLLVDGQLTDCGWGMESALGSDIRATDLRPSALASLHSVFASWLSRNRARVTLDVNLSCADMAGFRMYRLVYFRGRRWLVSRLTLSFSADGRTSARGEFIEV